MRGVFARRRLPLAAAFLLLLARTAAAQSGSYVTAAAFADLKRFSSSQSIGYFVNDSRFSLDATSPGGGVRLGSYLHPKWSIELGVESEGRTTVKIPNPYSATPAIYPPVGLPVRIPDTSASTRFLTVSTIIGFHPNPGGRIRPAYFAGFTLIHATYISDYFNYIVPLAASIATAPAGTVIPVPPPAITTAAMTSNTTGAVLGVETAIGLAGHLAVVPEVRVLTFSVRGDGVFLIRPGVGLRWSF